MPTQYQPRRQAVPRKQVTYHIKGSAPDEEPTAVVESRDGSEITLALVEDTFAKRYGKRYIGVDHKLKLLYLN